MLTFLCALRTGGDYDVEYVRKLRDGVKRHYPWPHQFVCLSNVEVPCDWIPMQHEWPGWWCKMEIFRPGIITGPTLFLDLDTVIVGDLQPLEKMVEIPFAMLDVKESEKKIGNSGAMWFNRPFEHIYNKFAEKPDEWIKYHVKNAYDRYMGDQAFISDCFDNVPKLHHYLPGFFKSYKYDRCELKPKPGASVICFGGPPRPAQAGGWVKEVWK